MTTLDVDRVTVSFGERTVLHDASLHLDSGEIVAIHGPSGSGKSTLLRAICGIVPIDRGAIVIDGVDVTASPTHRRNVGMVFQDDQLFPHRTVRQNIAFGLQMRGVGRADRTRIADGWIETVGLAGFADRHPDRLSGGEAKRVALARTLAAQPAIVLLDEPLAGLDDELHDRLADDIGAVLAASGTTAILVTHDRDEGAILAHRSIELADITDPSTDDR